MSKAKGTAMKVLPDKATAMLHRHQSEPGSGES